MLNKFWEQTKNNREQILKFQPHGKICNKDANFATT